jgi:YD repeat-containing protein
MRAGLAAKQAARGAEVFDAGHTLPVLPRSSTNTQRNTMVAIVSGMRAGLDLGSREVLGQSGVIGHAMEGRNGQGVYVNVATGLLTVQNQDDLLVARGQDAAVLRTYNSGGTFNDDNGDNWSSAVVSLRLSGALNSAGSSVERVDRDGSVGLYSWDAVRGVYVSSEGAGAYDLVSYVSADGQFEWRDGGTGVTQRFEGGGQHRLLSAKDTHGNETTYAYGARGFLASVTTASGESTFYDYAGSNLSQVRTVAAGTTSTRVRYGYDTSERLTSVTVDLSPSDNGVADGQVYQTTYAYDGASRRIASIGQSDGTSLAFTYVDVGGGTFKLASVRDGLGQAGSFVYGAGFTTFTDALGLVTRYDHDAAGQLTKITTPAVAGAAATRQFAYNGNGDVISVTDGEGRSAAFQYDANRNQVLQRDALGNTVARTFDARNQLLTETVFRQPDPDGPGGGSPGAPATTRYVYDAAARNLLRFTVSAEGRVTEHRYNGFGERVSSITYVTGTFTVAGLPADTALSEGQLTAWAATQNLAATQRVDAAFDGRGQAQSRTVYARVSATGDGIVDGSHSVERYVYDASGLLLQTVSPSGGTSSWTYDGLGRAVSSTNPLGQLAVTQYDDAGRRTVLTLATGLVTTSVYDAAGRLATVSQASASGAGLGQTRYFHDPDNRLRMTQDPTGVRSWLLYDEAGRRTADIDGNGTMTEYSYDRSGQVLHTITWGTAVDTGALVDASGLPVTSVTVAGVRPAAGPSDHAIWRQYDAAGRLVRTAEQCGTTDRAAVTETRYDGASQVVEVLRYANTVAADGTASSVAAGSVPLPAVSADDRSTRHFYDADGRLEGTLDPEGYVTTFKYDAAGQLVERVAYATPTGAALRASSALAQLVPAVSATDIREVSLYDGKGQEIAHVDGEGYLGETVYDANGNVTQTVRYATRVAAGLIGASSVAAIRPAANAADRVTTRSYDALNRLLQETSSDNVVTQYAYDTAGNLASTVRAAGTAEVRTLLARHDLQGRLVGELSAEGAALLTGGETQAQIDAIWTRYGMVHTYDAASRRTSTTDAVGVRTLFFYDADGALTHTVNALGEVQETRYDARGRVSDKVTYANRIASSGLSGGLVTATLTTALAAAANPALDSRTTFAYTHDDRLASTTDSLGTVTIVSHNAFGEEIATRLIGTAVALTETHAVDHRGLRTGTVRDASGVNAVTSAVYDAFGRLIRSIDANGNVREQGFDRLGRSITTRDPTNAARSSSYDAFGRVLAQTDALGTVTGYAYDASARSMTVTTPEGIATTTAYTRHGQVQSISDGRGQVTSYRYDRNGNLLETSTPLTATSRTYDVGGRLTEVQDANGNKVGYSYDAANRVLTRRVDPAGLNLTTTYQYDGRGRRVSVTDPNGVVTATEFDRKGQVLRQTVDPTGLNLQTLYTYDAAGSVLTVRSAGGTVTQYSYDALGRRTQERVDPSGLNLGRSWAYDRNGNVISGTDARGEVTRYAYGADDRLTFTVDPLGNVRQNSYDPQGRVVKTVSYATPIAVSGLGAAAAVAQIQALVIPSPATDQVEHRTYDRDGRLAATVDGTGAVVKYSYDANGNVATRTAFANRIDMAAWTPGTAPTPQLDSARDATVCTLYDALDRAIYSVDGVGAAVAQSYDGNGKLLQRIAYAMAIPTGTTLTAASVASAVAAVANAACDASVRNTYDAAGRLTWSVDGTGAVAQRLYDGNGNVVRQVAYATPVAAGAAASSVPAGSNDRATAFAYDGANRLVLQVDALGGVTEQVFDAEGHVIRRTGHANPIAALPALGTAGTAAAIRAALAPNAAADRSTRIGYDAAGREALRVDAVGAVTETQYDGTGNAIAVTAYATPLLLSALDDSLTLGAMKALIASNATDRTTRNAYDASGRMAYAVDALGAVKASQYDGVGRLTRSTRYATTIPLATDNSATGIAAALRGDAATDQSESFSYNAAGQLVSCTDALGATETYAYDALGRKLSFVNKKGATWTYTYDAAGRMLSETTPQVLVTSVNPKGNNAMLATAPVSAAVVTRMAYDALGNLTLRTEAAGRPEERTTRYEYDALARQVRVIYPTTGVYNTADVATVNGASGVATRMETQVALEARTFYDAMGNAVASRDVGGGLAQKAYDLVGRVAYDVDAMGYVTRYSRNAFGEATALTRYAAATTLAAASVTQAAQAADRSRIEAVLNAAGVDHSADRTVLTAYDRAGRGAETSEPVVYVYDSSAAPGAQAGMAGKTTRSVYDAFGQLVQVQALRNAATGKWSTTTHYFDKAGREIASIDAMGYLTTRRFDAVGNLAGRKEYATAVTAPWTTATYVAAADSAEDRETAYSYDRLNRRTGETRVNVEFSTGANGTRTRGNLTTTFGYDAVGNQTSVTDAASNATYTYYDALGRVEAIALPARSSTVTGTSLTPLIGFRRDAHGNVVLKTEYFIGAYAATAAAYNAPTSGGGDRNTYSQYDASGHVKQTMDAVGAIVYFSYDAYGHVAKQWQGAANGVGPTVFEVSVYDQVGRLVESRTPASTTVYQQGLGIRTVTQAEAGLVTRSTEYNAFGEVTRKGVQGGRQEYFSHDNAGRLWRTNGGDGVDRIQLFDAQGNVTAEIRSSGAGRDNLDVTTFTDVQAAAQNPYTRRTDIQYDALGRVSAKLAPERQEIQGGVVAQRQYLAATIVTSPPPSLGENEYVLPPVLNAVNLTWNSMAQLGSGDIRVYLEYRTPVGVSGGYYEDGFWVAPQYSGGTPRTYMSGVLQGDAYASGGSVQWQEPATADSGVGSVTRIVVYKKDAAGNWQVMLDQPPGYGTDEVVLAAPPDPATGVSLVLLRPGGPAGVQSWSASLTNFGRGYRFNAAGLPPGTYPYQVVLSPPGGGTRVTSSGVFSVTSGGLTRSASLNGEARWLRPTVLQKTDRWGSVIEITDPRASYWKTTYRYNASDQLVEQRLPDTAAGAAVSSIFYDAMGRQVAVKDANGNVNGQVFDAGGNLVQELHADGGLVTHAYSVFGQKVRTTNPDNKVVSFGYDDLGRLVSMAKGVAGVYRGVGYAQWVATRNITEFWTYDKLGRKASQTNGDGEGVWYGYDLIGNMVATRRGAVVTVRAAYDANGRKIAEVDANGCASTWTYSYFGQLTGHADLGGATYSYTYDNAKQLTYQSSTRGQSITYEYDAAGQLTASRDWADDKTTTSVYDLAGRKVRERVMQAGSTYQDNHLAYDARGNLRDVADARAHVVMDYDRAGNRTRVATFVDYQGVFGEAASFTDRYFQYDAMNRQVVVDAVDTAGNLGTQGHRLTYDRNGNRTSDTFWGNQVVRGGGVEVTSGYYPDGSPIVGTTPVTYTAVPAITREEYGYDALNRLERVVKDGVQIDLRLYDGADRVILSGPNGGLPVGYAQALNQGLAPGQMNGNEIRTNRYDSYGRLVHQEVRRSDGTQKLDISWDPGEAFAAGGGVYYADGYDAAGNVLGYVVRNYENGGVNEYTMGVGRFEGYQVTVTNGASSIQLPGSSTQQYDANGFLVGVVDSTQSNNNRTFVNDASGRALFVNQAGHIQRQLIVNGEVLGLYGAGVNAQSPASGYNNNPNFANVVDFDFGYSPISANYPGPSPGTYTVRTGDTLQSIAQGAYGDSSLWYRIAEANGLATDRDLRVGQTVNIPNRVSTISNNSTTFKPYDPSRIEGDKTPSLATPQPKKSGGGLFGQLLMIIVAIVATILTAGAAALAMNAVLGASSTWAAGMAAIGGGTFGAATITAGALGSITASTIASTAIGAAVGSIASQTVGLATGNVDKFDWNGVALSALSGGIAAGLPANLGMLGDFGQYGNVMVRAAAANAITQGIGVVTGVQRSFDWRGVAGSAVGAGVGAAVGEALGLRANGRPVGVGSAEFFATSLAKGMAAGVAVSAARGGRVAVQQVAVDAFGNALGSSLASAMSSPFISVGEAWAADMAERKRSLDPLGLKAYANDVSGVMRSAQTLWGARPAESTSRILSDTSTNAEILESQMDGDHSDVDLVPMGGGNVRISSDAGGRTMVNGISVNERAARALQAGDLAGIGNVYRDYRLLGGLMSELQQDMTLNKLKGAVQEKLGMMRVLPPPEALGASLGMSPDGSIRYNNVDLIDRYSDALRKVEMWKQGIIELDTRSMLITSIGTAKLSPADWVAENVRRYANAFATGIDEGQRRYDAGTLRYPQEMPSQLQVGSFADNAARVAVIAYNRGIGVPEGPGQLLSMNRWIYDPSGSGAYNRIDLLMDLGPSRNSGALILRTAIEGKSSLAAVQSSSGQLQRVYEWNTPNIITVTRQGPLPWAPAQPKRLR